ncbi:MAG: hypothetical protein U0263_32030 [Polyangiaceae bacterium]
MTDSRHFEPDAVFIDHDKLIDGYGDLTAYTVYESFDTYCGICDAPTRVTAAEQKYLLEINGVPVKMLRGGAIYCRSCAERRARIKALKYIDGTATTSDVRKELALLRADEEHLRSRSERRYLNVSWPYAART